MHVDTARHHDVAQQHLEALHLSVKQEVMTWSVPGYDRIAGVHFSITNHGTETLEDVRIGLFADLDVSAAGESGGHLNDRVKTLPYAVGYNDGVSSVPSVDVRVYGADLPVPYTKSCVGMITGNATVVSDGVPGSGLPVFGVVPLSHTVDPIAVIRKHELVDSRLDPYVSGPADVSFSTSYFALDLPPGQGGPPVFDVDRYRAMAGQYPGPPSLEVTHDYAALVSCGPFRRMAPGQTLEFDLALVCAPSVDSIANTVQLAAITRRGNWISRYPDTTANNIGNFAAGKSGYTGHETCYEAPPGVNFRMDPHCYQKYPVDSDGAPPDYSIPMLHGACTWVDLDCDACTGFNGNETQSHWADPARVHVVPEGLSFEEFSPGDQRAARAQLGITGQEPMILFVGSVIAAKGVFDLVDACARLRDRQVRFQCCIVGKGNDLERVRHTIATQGLGRHVTCAGLRPHSELAQWFRASDVVALPSYTEGIPNVLREAIACGRPFVSTRVGGIPEIADPSLSRLTNAGDVEGLATHLQSILNDPLDVDSGVVRRINISWQESARRLEQLLLDAVASRTQSL